MNDSKQERHRKKYIITSSIFNKLVYWFAIGYIPPHLMDKFMDTLTPEEKEVFKSQYKKERYKIKKKQEGKKP